MLSSLRFLPVLLGIVLVLALASEPAEAARKKRKYVPPPPKYAALVVDAETGAVLFDRDSEALRYPASLTKMMTLYMLFGELKAGRLTLQSELTVSARAQGQPPSKLGLAAGETISVEDAIKALIVNSANDVAVVVAESVGGSEVKFAQRMTVKAHEIGMRKTTFRNASGLPSVTQRTTAHDLAVLGRRLMRDYPQYYHYFSTTSFAWNGRTYQTHNQLVKNYEGAEGMKTGYTRVSGFNLVTAAHRDGRRLVGVVMGGRSVRSRDTHMREILDAAFEAAKQTPALVASMEPSGLTPRLKPTLVAELVTRKEREDAMAKAAAGAALLAAEDREAGDAAVAFADQTTDEEPTATGDPSDVIRSLIVASAADPAAPSTTGASEPAVAEGDSDADFGGATTWSVQIGAYSSRALAGAELTAAANAAALGARSRLVEPFKDAAGKELFRARFVSLTAGEASDVCDALKRVARTCFVASAPLDAAAR